MNMNSRVPARHRSRASSACLACRKARIRCVAGLTSRACLNCSESGHECRFDTRDGRKERASAKAATESLTRRVHQLEELLKATQSASPENGSATEPDGANSKSMGTSPAVPASADADSPSTDTASVVRSLVPSPIRFDMSSGRVRYFGPTTNMNVLTHPTLTSSSASSSSPASSSHWPISLVVRDLSRPTHDYLMELYWSCYNSVLHLVHSDAFAYDLEHGGTQFYSLFLHLAMLATGFRFADKTRRDTQRLCMAGRFASTLHEKAVALAKQEFDRPGGLPSIQAFGLLADVEFNLGRDESGWLFAGMSLRLVIDVGLHVDPSPLQLTVKEAQIRHMVLWACVLHDMYWSLYLGRPTTLKAADIAPACLSKDFTRLICCRPSGHEKKLTTRIYEHLLHLMDLMSPLCDRSTFSRPARATETYFKMVALDEDLHGWYDALPKDLKWPPAKNDMPGSFYLLHTQYHAALILLHRPFVTYCQVGSDGQDEAQNESATTTNGSNSHSHFTRLSRSICAQHAGLIVDIFKEYRARFNIAQVFSTGLSHLGTAATTLMGEAVLLEGQEPQNKQDTQGQRGVVIAQLVSLRQCMALMTETYPPAHHMTRILDEFVLATRNQHGHTTGVPSTYPASEAVQTAGEQDSVPDSNTAAPSCATDTTPALPQQTLKYHHPFTSSFDELDGYGPSGPGLGSRKRPRVGNPCTFTPTVPASPSLQGLPFVPSSFLEHLDMSDLVLFPEPAGYSDYGFAWDPADMAPL